MAASTIPKSGGPGSSVELSPVTIAVRDKVIEKFADQPLDEMNESVKALLSREEDEQKRLGILAARVFILRQRILSIAEADPDRVVTGASPKPKDLAAAGGGETAETEAAASEWTRLRILEDCEVNGVRFPKTVIIDVKSADADRLVENGKAEVIEESEPAPAAAEVAEEAPAQEAAPAEDAAPADEQPEEAAPEPEASADVPPVEAEAEPETEDPSAMLEALSEASDAESEPATEAEESMSGDQATDDALDELADAEQEDASSGEAVIEAPSAAEVTAALEALGAGGGDENGDADPAEDASGDDAADVAAELAALSAATTASEGSDESTEDAADVAAALEAASAAMAAGPSNTDISDLPAAGAEQDEAGDDGDKPAGWFEAQQNAEKAARGDTSEEDGDNEDNDKS